MKYAVNDKQELLLCPFDDILEGYTEITKEEYEELSTPSLDVIKGNKHSELKSIMNKKREQLTVLYDNDNFNASIEAQNNMNSLLKAFDLGAESVGIRSATEKTHTFNKEHTQELSLLMLQAVNNLYDTYWKLKDQLSKCETVDAVNEIKWE